MTDKLNSYKMILFAGLFSLAFLSSCIFEDLSYCPPRGLKLIFSYTHNSQSKELFDASVDYLDLYIYDTISGNLVESRQLTRAQFENKNEYILRGLAEGVYRLVVWGNRAPHDYLLQNPNAYNNMLLSLIVDPILLRVDKKPEHLFHGTKIVEVLKYSSKKHAAEKIDLIKNTNDIKITLFNELTNVPFGSPNDFSLLISGSNGDYNFDNTQATASSLLTYIPQTRMENGKPVYEFRSLRLFHNDDTQLVIKDALGLTVFSNHLSGLLISKLPYVNNDSDLDRYDNYSLEIGVTKYQNSYIVSSIKVNGWGATKQPAAM